MADSTKLKKWKWVTSIFLCITILLLFFRYILVPHYFFPAKYAEYIEQYAKEYGVEMALVYAVIKTESSFDPEAKSSKNARGLMQLSESTGFWGAAELGIELISPDGLYDPEVNIQIGCWYLAKLLSQYNNQTEVALAAYNAGSGNVTKWLNNEKYSIDGERLSLIPFGETKRYVEKVERRRKVYQYLYRF